MEIKDTYRKPYQIRIPVGGRKSFIVTLPYEIVEREARKRGLSIEEFLQTHVAVAQYDNFDGVFYSFELTNKELTP